MSDMAKETKKRLLSARAHKALVVRDLQEAYFFIRPRMSRQVTSDSAVSRNVSDDADMLATGIGAEVAEDFATEMIAAFFPPHAPWASSEISLMPDTSDLASVEEDVAIYDKGVFSAIRRSNFNAEISVALDPDGALGTIALMISAPGAARPYRVEHVPLRELEISLGPDGEVDGRFRVRHVKASELTALLGADVVIPPKFLQPGNASKSVECAWGWWRDWSKPADDIFRHVLTLDGQVVVDESMTGTGSVPLVVMVFAPDRLHAFGNGPAIKCLQEFRVLDVFTEATQDSAIFAIKKPFLYPDDGVIDFEGGVEPGKGYPSRAGSAKDVVPIVWQSGQQEAFVTEDRIEHRIRRKFFADYPEQDGKTPPTATQWVDEMLRAQRRIGTPGQNFWRVGPKAIFERFAWMCEKDGLVEPVLVGSQRVPLIPQNPATQAQAQQELQVAVRLLELAKGFFPQTSQAAIDELQTIEKIKKLLRDEIVVLRPAAQVTELVNGIISQMQLAQAGGAQPGQAPA